MTFNPFSNVTKFNFPFLKKELFVSKIVNKNFKNYFQNLREEYSLNPESDEIISSFSQSLFHQLYPKGIDRADYITEFDLKTKEVSLENHYLSQSVRGFYRIKPSLVAGVIKGLRNKFNKSNTLIKLFGIVLIGGLFIFSPIIWLSIYFVLALVLPTKTNLLGYQYLERNQEIQKADQSIFNLFILPICYRALGFLLLIISILILIDHIYVGLGFTLISIGNWPRIWLDSNFFNLERTWEYFTVGYGLIFTSILISWFGLLAAKKLLLLKTVQTGWGKLVKPLVVLVTVHLFLVILIVPSFTSTTQVIKTKKININGLKKFQINNPISISSVSVDLIFIKSESEIATFTGRENTMATYEIESYYNDITKFSLDNHRPLKVCYYCNTKNTSNNLSVTLYSSSLNTVEYDDNVNKLQFKGFQKSEIKLLNNSNSSDAVDINNRIIFD